MKSRRHTPRFHGIISACLKGQNTSKPSLPCYVQTPSWVYSGPVRSEKPLWRTKWHPLDLARSIGSTLRTSETLNGFLPPGGHWRGFEVSSFLTRSNGARIFFQHCASSPTANPSPLDFWFWAVPRPTFSSNPPKALRAVSPTMNFLASHFRRSAPMIGNAFGSEAVSRDPCSPRKKPQAWTGGGTSSGLF